MSETWKRVETITDGTPLGGRIVVLLAEANEKLAERDAELLRVRTTQNAAAQAIDNIGVELGIGHSATPIVVQDAVRAELARLRGELEWAKAAREPKPTGHNCQGCKGTIWSTEARIGEPTPNSERHWHIVCKVTARAEAAEQRATDAEAANGRLRETIAFVLVSLEREDAEHHMDDIRRLRNALAAAGNEGEAAKGGEAGGGGAD